MHKSSRLHLSDQVVLESVPRSHARIGKSIAIHLADLGEFDARRLYRGEGYSSMHEYCVGRLGVTREAAFKRIRAARAVREFPALYDALDESRLYFSAIVTLAAHLRPDNVEELIAAAAGRNKSELERFLAWRSSAPVRSAGSADQLSPGTVGVPEATGGSKLSPGTVGAPAETGPALVMT